MSRPDDDNPTGRVSRDDESPRTATLETRSSFPLTEIGHYRIIREVGRGGMGQVFLAEQTEPVRRHVALKLIAVGLDSEAIVARFRVEQQTLARMSHPSIAQVHDAGTAPDGRPYFVMEYVDGLPFNAYCKERTLAERLELFVSVCSAVQHAHDRGVIHRDLKPSNVLVTMGGTAKVIDFGIAKAFDRGENEMALTRHDEVLGTPEYMSPEQARSGQLEVDERTDVYSLGVMLYELIAGERPFSTRLLRAAGIREMERIITETVPVPPSKRCPPTTRTDSSRRSLRELDWIVLKALEKEPGDRYPTVVALSEDVERYLADQPVAAGPPSTWYRLRKLVRRNRVPFVAALIVLVAVVGGSAASVRFGWLASDRAAETEAALADVGTSLGLALSALEEALQRATDTDDLESVRPELIEETWRLFDEFDASGRASPELRRGLASSLARVASLYVDLGRPVAAEKASTRALEIVEGLRSVGGQSEAHLLKLSGMACAALAAARSASGAATGALPILEQAVADLRAARELEEDPDALEALASALVNLGEALSADDPEVAIAAMEEALELGQIAPETPGGVVVTAMHRTRLAGVRMASGDLRRAESELAEAVDVLSSHLHVPGARRGLALALQRLAQAQTRLGRLPDAAATQERSVAQRRMLLELHPESVVRRYLLAAAASVFGNSQHSIGEMARALEAHREAVELFDDVTAQAPDDVHYRSDQARALYCLARTLSQVGGVDNQDEAEHLMTRAVQIADGVRDLDPESSEACNIAATATLGLAAMAHGADRVDEALRLQDEGIDALHGVLEGAPTAVDTRRRLVEAYRNRMAMMFGQGLFAETADHARRALDIVEEGLASSPDDHVLLTFRVELSMHIATIEVEETGDMDAAIATAESWVERWPKGIPAHLESAGFIAMCAEYIEDDDGRERRRAQAVELVAAALELGFEPQLGWPDPNSGIALLADRADFRALVGGD